MRPVDRCRHLLLDQLSLKRRCRTNTHKNFGEDKNWTWNLNLNCLCWVSFLALNCTYDVDFPNWLCYYDVYDVDSTYLTQQVSCPVQHKFWYCIAENFCKLVESTIHTFSNSHKTSKFLKVFYYMLTFALLLLFPVRAATWTKFNPHLLDVWPIFIHGTYLYLEQPQPPCTISVALHPGLAQLSYRKAGEGMVSFSREWHRDGKDGKRD